MPEIPEKHGEVSGRLEQLRCELEQWRGAHRPRSRLPEGLWAAAVQLAGQHGLYRTSRTLRLDYGGLKKKAQRTDRPATAPAGFVELIAPAAETSADCLIEVEGARGGKMRVQARLAPAGLARLMQAWRDAEA
jgi:hypothetical protein